MTIAIYGIDENGNSCRSCKAIATESKPTRPVIVSCPQCGCSTIVDAVNRSGCSCWTYEINCWKCGNHDFI